MTETNYHDIFYFHHLIKDYIFKKMNESISLGRIKLKRESDSTVTGKLSFSKLFEGEFSFEMDKSNGILGTIDLSDSLIRKILLDKYENLVKLLEEEY